MLLHSRLLTLFGLSSFLTSHITSAQLNVPVVATASASSSSSRTSTASTSSQAVNVGVVNSLTASQSSTTSSLAAVQPGISAPSGSTSSVNGASVAGQALPSTNSVPVASVNAVNSTVQSLLSTNPVSGSSVNGLSSTIQVLSSTNPVSGSSTVVPGSQSSVNLPAPGGVSPSVASTSGTAGGVSLTNSIASVAPSSTLSPAAPILSGSSDILGNSVNLPSTSQQLGPSLVTPSQDTSIPQPSSPDTSLNAISSPSSVLPTPSVNLPTDQTRVSPSLEPSAPSVSTSTSNAPSLSAAGPGVPSLTAPSLTASSLSAADSSIPSPSIPSSGNSGPSIPGLSAPSPDALSASASPTSPVSLDTATSSDQSTASSPSFSVSGTSFSIPTLGSLSLESPKLSTPDISTPSLAPASQIVTSLTSPILSQSSESAQSTAPSTNTSASTLEQSIQCPQHNGAQIQLDNVVTQIVCGMVAVGTELADQPDQPGSWLDCIETCAFNTQCASVSWDGTSCYRFANTTGFARSAEFDSAMFTRSLVNNTVSNLPVTASADAGAGASVGLGVGIGGVFPTSNTASATSVPSSGNTQSPSSLASNLAPGSTAAASSTGTASTPSNQGVSCPASNGTRYTDSFGASYTIACGLDFANGYMALLDNVASLSSCLTSCDVTPSCTAVSWDSVGHVCYLRQGTGTVIIPNANIWAAAQVLPPQILSSASSLLNSLTSGLPTVSLGSTSLSTPSVEVSIPNITNSLSGLLNPTMLSDVPTGVSTSSPSISPSLSSTSLATFSTPPACPASDGQQYRDSVNSNSTYLVQCGYDFTDNDYLITQLVSDSIGSCFNACANQVNCASISYYPTGTVCRLWAVGARLVPVARNVLAARKILGTSTAVTLSSISAAVETSSSTTSLASGLSAIGLPGPGTSASGTSLTTVSGQLPTSTSADSILVSGSSSPPTVTAPSGSVFASSIGSVSLSTFSFGSFSEPGQLSLQDTTVLSSSTKATSTPISSATGPSQSFSISTLPNGQITSVSIGTLSSTTLSVSSEGVGPPGPSGMVGSATNTVVSVSRATTFLASITDQSSSLIPSGSAFATQDVVASLSSALAAASGNPMLLASLSSQLSSLTASLPSPSSLDIVASLNSAIASASGNPALQSSLSNALASFTSVFPSSISQPTFPSISTTVVSGFMSTPSSIDSLSLLSSINSVLGISAIPTLSSPNVVASTSSFQASATALVLTSTDGSLVSISMPSSAIVPSVPISVPSALSLPNLVTIQSFTPSFSVVQTGPSSAPSLDFNNAVTVGNAQVQEGPDNSPVVALAPDSNNPTAAITLPIQNANSITSPAQAQFSIRIVPPVVTATPSATLPAGRLARRQTGAGCMVEAFAGNSQIFNESVADLTSSYQTFNSSQFTTGPGQTLTFAEVCTDAREYVPIEIAGIKVGLVVTNSTSSPMTNSTSPSSDGSASTISGSIPTTISASAATSGSVIPSVSDSIARSSTSDLYSLSSQSIDIGPPSGPFTVPASTCSSRSRVIVTVTSTVTACPGSAASTCTWKTAFPSPSLSADSSVQSLKGSSGSTSSPRITSSYPGLSSSTHSGATTTITTVLTLCFTCALTPTVVASTYTETMFITTDDQGVLTTVIEGGPPAPIPTTTVTFESSSATPKGPDGSESVTTYSSTQVITVTSSSPILTTQNGQATTIYVPTSYVSTTTTSVVRTVNPNSSASSGSSGFLTTRTELRTYLTTKTALSTSTSANGQAFTTTSSYTSTGTSTAIDTLSIVGSTTLTLTSTILTLTYTVTASLTSTLSDGQLTTYGTTLSTTSTQSTLLTLSGSTSTFLSTQTTALVTTGSGGVLSTATTSYPITATSVATLTLQATTQTSTQLTTSSFTTTGPDGRVTTVTTAFRNYVTRVMTNTLVASTQTLQQTLPTTLTSTASNGQATTLLTNVVSAQITTLISTIGSGNGPTVTVFEGATIVVSGDGSTVGANAPTQTVNSLSISDSYIATTEQVTSASYGVTSTTITTTDSAGKTLVSTSYGVQGYTFTSLRTTSVLAHAYNNGGGSPMTVTISVTGQTTITNGQTVTLTQNAGTVTTTAYQNGTVTITGPTVTTQQIITATQRPGSTALPNCPNETPGRTFDCPYGGEYAIYCGYAYQDDDCTVVTSSSLGACAQACDAYNIQHFYDTTTCAGVTFFNTTGQCHLKRNTTIFYATNGADSCKLENPYKGGVTQLFPSGTNMGAMGAGPTVTVTSIIAGYTPETLVNCPQDNGTVITSGSNADAFLVECNINRPGDDVSNSPYYVSSFRSCIDACGNDPTCYDCTFFPSSAAMNPCYLKTGVPNATVDNTCWSARAIQGPVCPRDDGRLYVTQGEDLVVECFTDRTGCDFVNMPILTDTFGECMDLCAANQPQCADVSWRPGSPQGACTLKSCIGTPVANQTKVWGGRILNATGSGGGTVTSYQSVTATVTTTLVSNHYITVTVPPSSSSSSFSCLTHMTNYLPASASGGFKVKRNEYLFPDVDVHKRAEFGARTVRGGLGWVV